MKKITIGSFLLIATSITSYANNFYLKFGADMAPTYTELSYTGSDVGYLDYPLNTNKGKGTAGEVTLEYTRNINTNLEIGFGISFQRHAEMESMSGSYNYIYGSVDYESDLVGFDSIPIYVTGKYNFNEFAKGARFYLKADAGFSYNDGDGYFDATTLEKSGNITVRTSDYATVTFGNGYYAGAGIGLEYHNFVFDLMYKINSSKLELEGSRGLKVGNLSTVYYDISDSETIEYYRVVASIGYKF